MTPKKHNKAVKIFYKKILVPTAHVEMRKTSKNISETLEISVKSEKNEIFGKVCNSAHWHHRMLIIVSTKNN